MLTWARYPAGEPQIFLGSREPHYAAMTLEVVKLALVGNPDATPPRQPPPDEDVLPAPKLLGTILQVSRPNIRRAALLRRHTASCNPKRQPSPNPIRP
jgi:hypothetical protein